uniref:Aminoglycoside N(3)-acetyltransferase n=1 Tax=uncultured Chloroflexota bacterium TaxID=166587 RepID=H5SCV7_9CHLR|nr:aminoglycoside N3'-acetyltransferase [uncultured Chloroflexota bacterium]
MLKFHQVRAALRLLDCGAASVIVHASLRRIGPIFGGAESLLAALLQVFPGVMAPTFTYKTMITPRLGPAQNGIDYAFEQPYNSLAEFFRPDLPADPLMGVLPEVLRCHPLARRTSHPILSFAGIHLEQALQAQTLEEPLAPIGRLAEMGGWVLLIGVDHTVNTAIHYAERRAGRKQFLRWALTLQGVVACPGFPGCSLGFEAIRPRLEARARRAPLGNGWIEAIPLPALIEAVQACLAADPLALLCDAPDCLRCQAVRASSL